MPSFDIVSEVDQHEITNTLDQSNREISSRFDFKGSDAQVTQSNDNELLLEAQAAFQIEQMLDMLYKKAAKRGIDVKAFQAGEVTEQNRRARLTVAVQNGIATDMAKRIVKLIKDSKLKVQPAIQGEQVRVTGKKRDDLQQVIAMLREQELDIPLQFQNFRD